MKLLLNSVMLALATVLFFGHTAFAQNQFQFDQNNSEQMNNFEDNEFDDNQYDLDENENENQDNIDLDNNDDLDLENQFNSQFDDEFNNINMNEFENFIDDENENSFFNNAASKFGEKNKFNNLGDNAILPITDEKKIFTAIENEQAYFDYYRSFPGGRPEGVAFLVSEKVNVYRNPSADADLVRTLTNVADVHIIARYGAWFKIGQNEWVDASFVIFVGMKTKGLNPPQEAVSVDDTYMSVNQSDIPAANGTLVSERVIEEM